MTVEPLPSVPSDRSTVATQSRVAQTALTQASVFIDLTHLGRHVTGIERVSIEQFEKVDFAGATVTHVRSSGVLSMIWRQQVWLPLLALLNPTATFVFPGFPPSPPTFTGVAAPRCVAGAIAATCAL